MSGDLLENAYREVTSIYMKSIEQKEDPTFLRDLINSKDVKEALSLKEAQELLGKGAYIVKIPDIDLKNTRKILKGNCHWYANMLANFRDETTELPVNEVKLSDFSIVKMEVWNCVHCMRNEVFIPDNYLVDAYLVSYSLCNSLVSVKHLMQEIE